MHLLVAAHDLYPDAGSGGTGRYVYETARRFVDRGHRVSVVTRRRGAEPRREHVAGIEVYRYDITIVGESAPRIVGQIPRARRSVREHVFDLSRQHRPDIVSFQGLVTPLLVDRAVPDTVPRVTTFHSPWPAEYAIRTHDASTYAVARRWLNIANRWAVERHLLARSDGVITLSGYMLGQLRQFYGSDHPAAVVPGGVDAGRFSPAAGGYGPMEGDEPAFLTVRRLMKRMGHGRLLDAFATVLETSPDARLYIAGDGPIRGRLEARAADLGIGDRTVFLGYVPDDDLPAAYATADVFVLPTQQLEGFGLATLEALAAGTPVLATPVGGTLEVLSGLRGRLPADPLTKSPRTEALADGMGEWIALDPPVRARAGALSRQYVCDRFSWDQTVSALLEEYERYR